MSNYVVCDFILPILCYLSLLQIFKGGLKDESFKPHAFGMSFRENHRKVYLVVIGTCWFTQNSVQ